MVGPRGQVVGPRGQMLGLAALASVAMMICSCLGFWVLTPATLYTAGPQENSLPSMHL